MLGKCFQHLPNVSALRALGGIVEKIVHVQRRKYIHMVGLCIFAFFLRCARLEAMLRKLSRFTDGIDVHMVCKKFSKRFHRFKTFDKLSNVLNF